MFKFNLQLFVVSIVLILSVGPRALAQTPQLPPGQQPQQAPQEHYHESALRRFEIITLSSLPFTAVHSYLVTRCIKMYRENQFAPELSPRDYRIIGIGAASLSLFIGVWDWWRTRDVDSAAPRIQEREPPPPTEEAEPVEGPIARLPRLNQPRFVGASSRARNSHAANVLNRWASEPAAGVAVPLLLITF